MGFCVPASSIVQNIPGLQYFRLLGPLFDHLHAVGTARDRAGNRQLFYTYCISSNNSASALSYQWLPTSIQCGEAIARRRKENGRVGSASRGMVRRWGG